MLRPAIAYAHIFLAVCAADSFGNPVAVLASQYSALIVRLGGCMKIVALLLIAASTSFGLNISGVWRLRHASAEGLAVPIAVEVEQCGSDLQVLKVTATARGKHIEMLWLPATGHSHRGKGN
jgi:hypothetical protein